MPQSGQPSTPADRDGAQSRLRTLTRGAIIAATGATVAMGVVVAHDRPGSSAVKATARTGTSSSTTTSDPSDAGTTGTTGNTGTDSTTTTTTTTTAPTRTSSSATVTSGATS